MKAKKMIEILRQYKPDDNVMMDIGDGLLDDVAAVVKSGPQILEIKAIAPANIDRAIPSKDQPFFG